MVAGDEVEGEQQAAVRTSPGAREGLFVVFEGGDGAGKSTQVTRLVQTLTEYGHEVVSTREPGGTELGRTIRELLLAGSDVTSAAEALLFAADRAHHVAAVIRPALAAGKVVISDRYVDSTLAYQGARAELEPGDLRALATFATDGLVPDLTVLLDVTPDVGEDRRGGANDRIESESASFHEAVRAGFLALAREAPERYVVLDAGGSVESIAAAVLAGVQRVLGERR